MQAPRGNQLKIKGNIVNVPADVNNTVNVLPRLPQESGTVKVQLKRRLQYKSSALSLNVRPYKILQAANWLAANSNLYREHGISFSEDRIARCNLTLQNETESEDTSQASCNEQISDTCNAERPAGKETRQENPCSPSILPNGEHQVNPVLTVRFPISKNVRLIRRFPCVNA